MGSLKLRVANVLRRFRVARPARTQADLEAAAKGPIVVAGLFSTASGIGESARLCADSLEATGVPVTRVDLSSAFRQTDLSGTEASAPFPPDTVGTLILHFNAPETLKALTTLGYAGHRKWRVIGYWVYELETIPPDWAEAAEFVSEIWTPSTFSANAIKKAIDLPVRVAPHPVAPPTAGHEGAEKPTPKNNGVTVLVMADSRSSLTRKNVKGAIDAYSKGLGEREDCRLIVKTRNLREHPAFGEELRALTDENPRIELIDEAISAEARKSLMAACDIFLSLHRSEGFGLTMAEAMALGKPVIATGWSGNMDFMDNTCAVLMPYTLIDVDDPTAIYPRAGVRWAEPDVLHAANALRSLADNPEKRTRLGKNARARIEATLSADVYAKALSRAQKD